MVLISIDPFAVRKLFLLVVALLCFSAACFADPLLMARRFASPADRVRAAAGASVSTGLESAGWAGMMVPYFADFESTGFAASSPWTAPYDGGRTSLGTAVLSSVFGHGSWHMSWRAAPAAIDDGRVLEAGYFAKL